MNETKGTNDIGDSQDVNTDDAPATAARAMTQLGRLLALAPWQLRERCAGQHRVRTRQLERRPCLTLKQQVGLHAAAANGSNRIVLRCPPSPGINLLTCADDLY